MNLLLISSFLLHESELTVKVFRSLVSVKPHGPFVPCGYNRSPFRAELKLIFYDQYTTVSCPIVKDH